MGASEEAGAYLDECREPTQAPEAHCAYNLPALWQHRTGPLTQQRALGSRALLPRIGAPRNVLCIAKPCAVCDRARRRSCVALALLRQRLHEPSQLGRGQTSPCSLFLSRASQLQPLPL